MNSLLTLAEFAKLPGDDRPSELVKGRVVQSQYLTPRHGLTCSRIGYELFCFLEVHPLGQVLGSITGVITERDPDTVRGADVAYYSYQRVPKGPLPNEWLSVAPELIFEVLSPDDRWNEVQTKVDEYLQAGVLAVCVVDDELRNIHAFRADRPAQILRAKDDLTLPDILPGFSVPVQRIFE